MINNEIKSILDLLEKNGFCAYLVGGCVRDFLMHIKTDDIDIATNATPGQIIDAFKDYKTIDIGSEYGTIIVLAGDYSFDITTYRVDGVYLGNRRPGSVEFTSELKEDIKRRDFTVNAIAYNGEFIDYYGGISDINNKIIRCVGEPNDRFAEDALRMLRAIRFSLKLGFDIEKYTEKAIFENMSLLSNISSERKRDELIKILDGGSTRILKYIQVLSYVIFDNDYETLEIDENILLWINSLDNAYLKLTVLLRNDDTQGILKRLKFDKKTVDKCFKIKHNLEIDIKLCEIDIKLWLNKLGIAIFLDILYINISKYSVFKDAKKENHYKNILKMYENVKGECYSLETLNISGDELISLGINPGKDIGDILDYLLNLVIYKKIPNDGENLKLYVKNNIKF